MFQVSKRNQVVIELINALCGHDTSPLTEDLVKVLKQLTNLNKQENSKVSLRARQVTNPHHVNSPWSYVKENGKQKGSTWTLGNLQGCSDLIYEFFKVANLLLYDPN